ncbi:hypothetical protein EAS64_30750 [Trebonia kvetii]|uniref:HTH-like domain-containing protein n=1 Tax=Trebonia kvetii TaxID=2480626 RepID=A0A6P2BUC1_9ACTN|nr:IS3 family transposase [Trebonia kvetii]TVZ01826.1 hypothetical protein EAS64_30750 [Trebonia kvetii]
MRLYPFIEAEKAQQHNVKRACELLKVSRSAYYAARSDEPSNRDRDDAELAAQVKTVHEDSKGRYGAPRVHAQLRAQGKKHSRKRVARLMRAQGLRGRAARRWKKTTIPDPAAAARADRIRRDFTADASKLNTRWCGDITYIATWEGWLYLSVTWNHRGVAPRERRDRPIASPQADGDGGPAGDGYGVVRQVAGSGAARAGC